MQYGRFIADGSQYLITTPKTPDTWFNYLFNDGYYMEVSQTAQGDSICLAPGIRKFTRGYRFFYLCDRQTKECWNLNHLPLKISLDVFQCVHALGWTRFDFSRQGIEGSLRVFVPVTGLHEVWTIQLRNTANTAKDLSLYSIFSFEYGDVMGSKCVYHPRHQILASYTFPYHVRYEEKQKLDAQNSLVFLFSNRPAASFDCSERRFFGGDDLTEVPAAILNDRCSNLGAETGEPVGALEHRLVLQPGEEVEFSLIVGCSNSIDEAAGLKSLYSRKGEIEREFERVCRSWDRICQKLTVSTPDADLNRFINYWLKKQVALMARTNRLSNCCPVRNQLQDAMGYSLLDPEGAAALMLKVLQRQDESGFIRQWQMTDGQAPRGLCQLKHSDGPVWLIMCFSTLLQQGMASDLLAAEIDFGHGGEKASVYDHLLRAISYLAGATGAHGLCLLGDGDWIDPINGPGRFGRGESTWLTMALKYAVLQLLPLCERKGDLPNAANLKNLAERLDRAINDWCWDGSWYNAGYDDDGVPFGCAAETEGRLFLNTQTWAVISQTARGERLEKCLSAIDALMTPCGPLLLDPPFTGWDQRWGRISLKAAGTTENGSVYCHASMFKAYADCLLKRREEAYETIRRTLPTNPENPPEKSRQVPLFVPNYYFGLRDSPDFGRSSRHHFTGTCAWMLWVVVEHLLGVKATMDGLEIDPCLPPGWETFTMERSFRNARYHITIRNPQGFRSGANQILVDGEELGGSLLPYEDGRVYRVEALV